MNTDRHGYPIHPENSGDRIIPEIRVHPWPSVVKNLLNFFIPHVL
jgi:hypothetical protein